MAIDITPILEEVNSLCSADKANINNTIFEQYILDEDFAQHHYVMTEVRNNQIIPLMDARPDYGFLKVSPGNCDVNVCEYNATSSAKKWNPADYDCRLEICKQTLDCDFRKFWNMNCKDFANMDDAFMDFLIRKVRESVNASQWRIGYFDTSDNTNPLYAGIDGLFEQWLTLAPDGAPNHIDIPENAGATIPAQLALDPARGYEVFKAMYDYALVNNTELLVKPGIHFDATPVLALNYLQYLRTNKEIECCQSITGADGITRSGYTLENLNYMGIPIYLRYEWKNIIEWQRVQSGAANLDNPHRAVLTYTGNKPIGTCDDDAFRSFDMWYERKDKTIYIDVATSFDAKILVNEDFVIAM